MVSRNGYAPGQHSGNGPDDARNDENGSPSSRSPKGYLRWRRWRILVGEEMREKLLGVDAEGVSGRRVYVTPGKGWTTRTRPGQGLLAGWTSEWMPLVLMMLQIVLCKVSCPPSFNRGSDPSTQVTTDPSRNRQPPQLTIGGEWNWQLQQTRRETRALQQRQCRRRCVVASPYPGIGDAPGIVKKEMRVRNDGFRL